MNQNREHSDSPPHPDQSTPEREDVPDAHPMETVGAMAAGIAHEFNNLLTPIEGYIELALDYLGSNHPVSDGLRTALGQVEHCTELISQIQAFGRKSVLRKSRLDPASLLSAATRLLFSAQPDKTARISLKREWPASLPEIEADRGQVQRAILHLLQNAVNAMPDGGDLVVRAAPHTLEEPPKAGQPKARPGTYVAIGIIDTGTGIEPDVLQRVFEPFFTTRDVDGARGMGLPMVQGMVDQHGGWMEIQSEPGKGTEATLFFPVAVKDESMESGKPRPDAALPVLPAAPIGTMLVADDEKHIRKLIRKIFEPEGWRITEAPDHTTVIHMMESETTSYDVILLDVTMPGPGAEESMSRILQHQPRAKILVFSGFTIDHRIQKLLEMGSADFINKPFSPRKLLTKIDAIMSRASSQ